MPNFVQRSSKKLVLYNFIIAVAFSVMAAFISDHFSEPPEADASEKYSETYEDQAEKMLTQEEFEKLQRRGEEYINRLNNKKSNEKAVAYIIKAKLLLVPSLSAVFVIIGVKCGMKSVFSTFAASVLIVAGALLFVNLIEAVVYSVCYGLSNIVAMHRKKAI